MCKISYIIFFQILLIILTFWDNIKADDYGIKQLENLNADNDGQNQKASDENGNGWMNNVINMGINSTKNIANYMKEKTRMSAQNKIVFEFHANIGKEMEKDMKKIGEIVKRIMEIDVNVNFKKMNGKNDGIVIQVNLNNAQTGIAENRQIIMALLFDKDGKMEMNSVELGKELIRQICGGNECDQPDDLPEFGANPWNAKPPPKLDELDRSLRPMLLKLASKHNKGRLWTDNPIPDYKNGFYVAFDWEVKPNVEAIDSGWLPVLKVELERFEGNAPIHFVELPNDNIGAFKNRLHFVIHNGFTMPSYDGLQRNSEKNFLYLNANKLKDRDFFIQDTLLFALGANSGKGLRIEYDRRDKYMKELRRKFAQLNAAYGAENYVLPFTEDIPRIHDKPEVEFWMGPEYANFVTGKYEIPVVYDESFKEIANQNHKLLEEVYENFVKNSVIQFVVHEEVPKDKNYVRIYLADKDDDAFVEIIGRTRKLGPFYQGETVKFGKNRVNKRALYHELMHAAGLDHEHQRADVEKYLGVDRQKAGLKGIEKAHYMPHLTYLPLHEYNPRSIMHYNMSFGFKPKSEKIRQKKDQVFSIEPTQMDWENLNHFYGVGKGRTQFKVIDENGQQKIVEDIDGMRRLKK